MGVSHKPHSDSAGLLPFVHVKTLELSMHKSYRLEKVTSK